MSFIQELEEETIYIIREAAATIEKLVMLYSMGKDSGVMLHIAKKAFDPAPIPFPLMHVDTKFKFPEMYESRELIPINYSAKVIVESYDNDGKYHPYKIGCDACCRKLKTQALLDAIKKHGFVGAFGGARRDEEKSRAKERIFSIRNEFGEWNPKLQRPEPWKLYNTHAQNGETIRIFPLSNWSELDVWRYVALENIPVVPLYFAKPRYVIKKNNTILPCEADPAAPKTLLRVRYRSLGCIYCTGAVESEADTIEKIIEEITNAKKSEREFRLIDSTSESSMEAKKKEGYF